jgi:hypothetical protein
MSGITCFDGKDAPSTTWVTGQTHGDMHAEPHTDYFADPRAIDPQTADVK